MSTIPRYVMWMKEPLVLRRSEKGHSLLNGMFLYQFRSDGSLERCERLTEAMIKVALADVLEKSSHPGLDLYTSFQPVEDLVRKRKGG